ncbi:hypothetical protein Pan161_48140 [Gimesia algae]|uniref:Uncharacterized protein n=1 Tax=Gimesia algae TaxID=2527971 RepID=A0A517VJF7_9PLAN|nr:hypothetical protein Pan161_48140 [Gimesia algae]
MSLMCLFENAARNAMCKLSIVFKIKESNGFSDSRGPIIPSLLIMHPKAS